MFVICYEMQSCASQSRWFLMTRHQHTTADGVTQRNRRTRCRREGAARAPLPSAASSKRPRLPRCWFWFIVIGAAAVVNSWLLLRLLFCSQLSPSRGSGLMQQAFRGLHGAAVVQGSTQLPPPRPLSEWEIWSGNVPVSHVSYFSTDNLRHFSFFAILLAALNQQQHSQQKEEQQQQQQQQQQ